MDSLGRLSMGAVQVSERLASSLERMIVEGNLTPGDRLPAEREFAESLGVSRTSVREAMRELQLKGLIDRRPGRGTIVLNPARTDRGAGLLARLDEGSRRLREVMDLRAAIEPPVAARAALRAHPRDIEDMRAILDEARAETSDDRYAELDMRFHHTIARSTHNPLLVEMVEHVGRWLAESRRTAAQTERRRRASQAAHEEILAGIIARDADAAERAMRRHIETVNSLLMELEGDR